MERPMIVCLCGSTRFGEAFHNENVRETLLGHIVLSIGCDFKSDADLLVAGDFTEEDRHRLDELHLRKIDLADEVVFLNVDGYLGHSSLIEHFYAGSTGKTIRYLEQPSPPNRYYVESHAVGRAWLKEQQQQGRLTSRIPRVNRRSWFPEDTSEGLYEWGA